MFSLIAPNLLLFSTILNIEHWQQDALKRVGQTSEWRTTDPERPAVAIAMPSASLFNKLSYSNELIQECEEQQYLTVYSIWEIYMPVIRKLDKVQKALCKANTTARKPTKSQALLTVDQQLQFVNLVRYLLSTCWGLT